MKVLSRTQNGQIFLCNACLLLHVEFKNLSFNFTEEQFNNFIQYIQNLNGDQIEQQNNFLPYQRKIIIPIGHQSFSILINKEELNELIQLFVNVNLDLAKNALEPSVHSDQRFYKELTLNDLNFTQYFN